MGHSYSIPSSVDPSEKITNARYFGPSNSPSNPHFGQSSGGVRSWWHIGYSFADLEDSPTWPSMNSTAAARSFHPLHHAVPRSGQFSRFSHGYDSSTARTDRSIRLAWRPARSPLTLTTSRASTIAFASHGEPATASDYDPQIGQGLAVSAHHLDDVSLFDYRHRIPFYPRRHSPESGLFTGYTELSTALDRC